MINIRNIFNLILKLAIREFKNAAHAAMFTLKIMIQLLTTIY